jgi:signal transduction histidine kinase
MRQVFKKVKADKRIIIGYSASLILLLITYIVTILANGKLKERAEIVDHTNNMIFTLEQALSIIKDAETGFRGYVLTQDINFLDPYIGSKGKTDSLYKYLVANTTDNLVQQDRLAKLKNLTDERFQLFEKAIDHFKSGYADSTFKVTDALYQSKNLMTKTRLTVSIMQNEERHLLARRDQKLKSTFASISAITITSLLLTLLLVAIGFITYTNENKGRKIATQNIKEYQQQLSKRIDELNVVNAQLVQMRSMEKFAATGRIARTIAHEVRNPLTNINLASSQLKTEVNGMDENSLFLFDIIERNSNRINKLISDLLQTTKFSELNFTGISVNDLLDDALLMAQDRIGLQHITIKKNYEATCNISVDTEKMKIAFLNIIVNAIEAMEPGYGTLTISTKTTGQKCQATIADNGTGMDETSLAKLFEPYFTSKANGNGMGLANTQNIIFNHKGTIHVSSTFGKGTIFDITLVNGR